MLTVQNENGKILAYLNNLESGTIKEAINGEYVLDFIATIEPLKTEFLYDENNLIEYNNDLFRITQLEELHNEDNMLTVAVTAVHISYDLRKNIMPNFFYLNETASLVMTQALLGTGFTLTGTDVTMKTDIQYTEECNSRQIITAIANNWQGELDFYRRDIKLLKQLGQNRGVDFRFGKNLKSIRRIKDYSENTISYEVDVQQGAELEELGYYELGDIIRVVDDALNINVEIRIVELEKDIVTGLNSRVVLGNKIKDLRTSFSSIIDATTKKVDKVSLDLSDAITDINKNMGDLQKAIEDGIIETFYQPTEPTGKTGDLWFNTSTQKLTRYDGYGWAIIEDAKITEAVNLAQSAQTTADGKIVSYYQTTMPTNGKNGDLWIDTANGNKLHRHNGTTFVPVQDTAIQTAQTTANNAVNTINANKAYWDRIKTITNDLGNVITSKLSGDLNLATNSILNSTGTFEQKDNALYWQNQPTKALSTFASMWNQQGIMFANSKNASGDWIWQSALNAEGLVANKVLASALYGLTIQAVTLIATNITSGSISGVNIFGSNITADNGSIQVKLNNSASPFEIYSLSGGVMKRQLSVLPHSNGGAISIDTGDLNETGQSIPYMTLGSASDGSGSMNAYIKTGRKYGGGYYNLGINAPYVNIYGSYTATGTKTAIVQTDTYGKRKLYSEESDRVYFNTKGLADTHLTTDGKYQYIIRLDEVFLQTIEPNCICPYIANITPYSNARVWVKNVYDKYIIVESDKETKFAYNIQCTRKNYENIYIEEVI